MPIAATIGIRENSKTEFALYTKTRILEEKLIEDCKKGKRKAQDKLYNKYCGAMLNVSMRYCQSQEEAEDTLSLFDEFEELNKEMDTEEKDFIEWK